MTRLPLSALAAAGMAAFIASAPAPAVAQDSGGETINQLIVYGDDPCPQSTADTITVCARKEESERFRIPENLRQSGSPENTAWNERVLSYESIGEYGTLSCSPVGAGGWTGCAQEMIDTAYAERENSSALRFSELIAEARAQRLAALDDEAAAEQARVEAEERAYFERQAEQQAAEAANEPGAQ